MSAPSWSAVDAFARAHLRGDEREDFLTMAREAFEAKETEVIQWLIDEIADPGPDTHGKEIHNETL